MVATKTEIMPCNSEGIALAVALLQAGEVVAFPTETVYGLGAMATNADAVHKIFVAKGRPADNPLIVHVAQVGEIANYAKNIPEKATTLIKAFWPGPLTLVLAQRDHAFPEVTTAGLATFAVRQPAHPAAMELLTALGCPLAAPSANLSGSPSPTTARHVMDDLQGRIPLILDGGACQVGLESTVLEVRDDRITLLRPGGVTYEMIQQALGAEEIFIAKGVDNPLQEGEVVLSPGMKHRHYAPKAKMVVVEHSERSCVLYDEEVARGGQPLILAASSALYGDRRVFCLGDRPETMLFDALRQADAKGTTLILFQAVESSGIGYAIMNRALRAAGFHIEL